MNACSAAEENLSEQNNCDECEIKNNNISELKTEILNLNSNCVFHECTISELKNDILKIKVDYDIEIQKMKINHDIEIRKMKTEITELKNQANMEMVRA